MPAGSNWAALKTSNTKIAAANPLSLPDLAADPQLAQAEDPALAE
jgi:hypothetical protein